MAPKNMGGWEENVLLKYYIPLRSTPFFMFYFFLFPPFPSLQRAKAFLEYPGFYV